MLKNLLVSKKYKPVFLVKKHDEFLLRKNLYSSHFFSGEYINQVTFRLLSIDKTVIDMCLI